jgi:hypothetical protein
MRRIAFDTFEWCSFPPLSRSSALPSLVARLCFAALSGITGSAALEVLRRLDLRLVVAIKTFSKSSAFLFAIFSDWSRFQSIWFRIGTVTVQRTLAGSNKKPHIEKQAIIISTSARRDNEEWGTNQFKWYGKGFRVCAVVNYWQKLLDFVVSQSLVLGLRMAHQRRFHLSLKGHERHVISSGR